MTVLADYTFIEGGPVIIGDTTAPPSPENPFRRDFKTGGRLGGYLAFLVLMVNGLNEGKGARVVINDKEVGTIFPVSSTATVVVGGVSNTGKVNDTGWRTLTISFNSDILHSGPNDDDPLHNYIQIDAVERANPQPGDLYENFIIRNVICFFKQET